MKYQDGYQRRQQAFHRNDDKHISVRELWDAWLRSEVRFYPVSIPSYGNISTFLALVVNVKDYLRKADEVSK